MGTESLRTLSLTLLLGTTLLAGCAHTYRADRTLHGERLPKGASFYIALPEPGSFEGRNFPDSPQQTVSAIKEALQPHASRVENGTAPEEYESAVASARRAGLDYAVVPVIKHWEERATEWSGKPDRIKLQLHILQVESAQTVDSAEITGRSRWGTFGGDHPEELLPVPVGDYIESLFQ